MSETLPQSQFQEYEDLTRQYYDADVDPSKFVPVVTDPEVAHGIALGVDRQITGNTPARNVVVNAEIAHARLAPEDFNEDAKESLAYQNSRGVVTGEWPRPNGYLPILYETKNHHTQIEFQSAPETAIELSRRMTGLLSEMTISPSTWTFMGPNYKESAAATMELITKQIVASNAIDGKYESYGVFNIPVLTAPLVENDPGVPGQMLFIGTLQHRTPEEVTEAAYDIVRGVNKAAAKPRPSSELKSDVQLPLPAPAAY